MDIPIPRSAHLQALCHIFFPITKPAVRHQVAPTQISTWKKEFLIRASVVFDKSTSKNIESLPTDRDELLRTIEEQKVEIDLLKKV